MLVEQTTVPTAVLPVTEFRDHLRLGSGFADDGLQDSVLEQYLRSSLSSIEARTGKVLLERTFGWTLTGWRERGSQALPVAPVSAITEVKLVDRHGAETVVSPEAYRLSTSSQRPQLVSTSFYLPTIPSHGSAEIVFVAGFGATWGDVPPDLGQAAFLLAAHFYEHRAALVSGQTQMPFGVSLLIDRYRTVRLFGEGGR